MERIREKAAGIDIGARKVFVSIEAQEVRCFFTFTEDFENYVITFLKILLRQLPWRPPRFIGAFYIYAGRSRDGCMACGWCSNQAGARS